MNKILVFAVFFVYQYNQFLVIAYCSSEVCVCYVNLLLHNIARTSQVLFFKISSWQNYND